MRVGDCKSYSILDLTNYIPDSMSNIPCFKRKSKINAKKSNLTSLSPDGGKNLPKIQMRWSRTETTCTDHRAWCFFLEL